jgi:hypothetical protein
MKMRAARIKLLGVLCAAGLAFAAEPDQKTTSGSSDALNVLYSGRFFGYFRYPDIQNRLAEGCPSDDQSLSAAAAEYLNHVGERPSGQIRVAMGDNFAPEFLSRTLYDDERPPAAFKSRDLYTPLEDPANSSHWIWTVDDPKKKDVRPFEGRVPSDNVGCFLKKAGFQAIVPGKDDFYFGPERVSQIANFLRQRSGKLEPVQMLGANLTVVTETLNGNKPLPIEKLDEKLQNVFRPKPGVKLSIPREVLPWLHQIDLREEKSSAPAGFLCQPKEGDPYKFEFPQYGTRTNGCEGPIMPTAGPKSQSWRFELPPNKQLQSPFFLEPGRNYVFCILHPSADASRDICQAFTTKRPLLEVYGAGKPLPYFVDAKESVAVFGVVDEDMLKQIGLLNYSWLNLKSDLATTLRIIPAADALEQVMQLCDEDSECKNARRRILLAQMPTAKAQDLTRDLADRMKIHFDLVITQVDRENFTGTTSLSRLERLEKTEGPALKVASRGPFIVVPDSQFEPAPHEEQFTVRVQQAHLQRKPCMAPCQEFWSYLQNDVEEYPLRVEEHEVPKIRAFEKTIQDSAKVKGDLQAAILSLTKERMQSFCHSDVAMLQLRDIFAKYQTVVQFWPRPADQATFDALFTEENYLEEILWKGDFAICRTITGAGLKKALQQSRTLEVSSPDLKLDAIGVEPDNIHDTFTIHGNQLDAKALYSVALTDFLAFGDTLYPDLAAPELPPGDTIHTFDHQPFRPIANIVAKDLYPKLEARSLPPLEYFDTTKDQPADRTGGFSNTVKMIDWFQHWAVPYDFTATLGEIGKKPDDKTYAQHRPLTFFNLEKLNVAYNLTTINGPQQLVNARFGSITNVPQLQNVEQQSVTIWDRVRFGHEFPELLDLFGMTDNRYGFKRQRKITDITSSKVGNGEITGYQDPYTSSIQDNSIGGEAGVLFKRVSKNIPFRFLISERMLTQLRRPLLSYTAPYTQSAVAPQSVPSNCDTSSSDVKLPVVGGTSSTSILCTVPRSYLQETKFGTRLENLDSWIEFGWQVGNNFNSTGDSFFNKNAPNQLACPANTELSLSDCIIAGNAANASLGINQLSPLYITHRTLPVSGAFVNFKILVPLFPPKLQLSIENYSEFFVKRADDNATDTRFYEDAIISLPIKLGQNFSFSPQVELFDFQNKVVPYHFLSLVSQFTLDYNFAWHSGVRADKALTYPYPTSVSKTQTLPVP